MRKHRILKVAGVIVPLFLLLSLLSLVGGAFVAEGTLRPARRELTSTDVDKEIARTRAENAVLSDVSLVARDGARLHAWNISPTKSNGNAVILLHGLSDNRAGMEGYADLLLHHGYSVLIPDARAHGASEGSLVTYGLLEADDIHRWFEWLVTRQHPHCIYGFGESMGAAQVLQALNVEPDFCAVAGECPFSSFRQIAYDRMGQHFGAGLWVGRAVLWPVVESAFLYSRWKYGLDFEQLSPEDTVAKTRVPVFLIHDQKDTNIPLRHSRRILHRNQNVVLWEVPQVEHSGAMNAYPEEFSRKLIGWFETHFQSTN